MWEINAKRTDNLEEVQKHFGLKYLPMTRSLLDTDLYKFSMGQSYHHQFGQMKATWDFKARNVGKDAKHAPYTAEDREEIKKQIQAYCALRFEAEELEWLKATCPWIHTDFTNFLKFWQPQAEDIEVKDDPVTGLAIETHGVQEYISFYEIPLLEIAAEVYYRNHYNYDELVEEFKKKTEEKFQKMRDGIYQPGTFSEFGARRRLSYETQDWLVGRMADETKYVGPMKGLVGTSNVYLAMRHGLKPVGTMAHEFIMSVGQGIPRHNPAYSNYYALDAWVKEYGVWNGIALTDTIGTDVFLKDFKKTFATLFSGVRHDSGDPVEWGEKMIAHYKSLGIDPMTKTLMFSDGLDLAKATSLNNYFKGKAKVAFGIGTDWSGPQSIAPLNIVCKVVIVDGKDVAKLSDAPGKGMCRNPKAVERLQNEITWRMKHEE